mgnify:CR=1 FL=1
MAKLFDKYLSRYMMLTKKEKNLFYGLPREIILYVTDYLELCSQCKKYQIYDFYQPCEKCRTSFCFYCARNDLNHCYNNCETISLLCGKCAEEVKNDKYNSSYAVI